MIQRETIEGRAATVAYMNKDFTPAESPESAAIVKVMYDDGDTAFGRRPDMMAALDIDVAMLELSGAKADVSLKDGTKKAGFVTAEDNRPPRQCDHCRWMAEASCTNPLVTADDEVGTKYGNKRNDLGNWLVDPESCCDNFQAGPNE